MQTQRAPFASGNSTSALIETFRRNTPRLTIILPTPLARLHFGNHCARRQTAAAAAAGCRDAERRPVSGTRVRARDGDTEKTEQCLSYGSALAVRQVHMKNIILFIRNNTPPPRTERCASSGERPKCRMTSARVVRMARPRTGRRVFYDRVVVTFAVFIGRRCF